MTASDSLEEELAALRQRVSELEEIEARCRKAETTLKDIDSQWNTLLEIVGDSVFVIDPAKHTILDVNRHAARRLGYTPEDLLCIPYTQIEIKPPDTAHGSAMAWESFTSGTRFYECFYRRKDGSQFPVEVSSRLINLRGQKALLNFARDISLRKQIEAEREQLITALDAYAHTVAHDLKSPVSVLLGYSEMLKTDFRTMDDLEVEDYLQTMHRNAQKLRNIIDELLLLASVRKMQEVNTEPVAMETVIGEALNRLAKHIEESSALISQPQSWPTALGYAPWVEEVWVNYISNAIKYGGTPPIVELGATVEGNTVYYWVRDNGSGVDAEAQSRLFQPFTRFDQARAQGHGLGLSIVKSIVTRLSGEVAVSSEPGAGSTFYFSLPAVDA